MRCVACGELVGENDRFCSRCGSPVLKDNNLFQDDFLSGTEEDDYRTQEKDFSEISARKRKRSRRFTATDQEYSEHLYRDSFYYGQHENRSHALRITLVTLLILAIGVGFFLLFYYHLYDRFLGREQQDPKVIEILSELEDNLDISAVDASGQNGDIVIIGEADASQEAGLPQAGQVSESQDPGTGTVDPAVVTQMETQPQTEAETEKDTQTTLQETIDAMMMQESTAQTYAVYISDLQGTKEYAAGAALDTMYASGTITVPILYAAAYLLDQGQITLNDQITYVNSIGGRGEWNPESREGYAYPLTYYLTTMLTYNDNNCMNCLIDYIGIDRINTICQSQGMAGTKIERLLVTEVTDGKENYVSAQDLTRMVRELYNGKFSVIGREFMKNYFHISEDDANRTLAGLAQGPDTAPLFLNQNGKGDTRFAETAVIGDDQCSYIISILCKGDYGFIYEDAVKDVSSYVWDALHEAA